MTARVSLLFILVASLVGCTSSTQTPSIQTTSFPASPSPAILAPAPQTCPEELTAARLGKNDVPGLTHSIVPGDPQVLVVCGSRARVVVTDASRVQRIADTVNALELVPQGVVFDCAMYVRPVAGLFFNYANGDVLLVQVGGPCNTVSNGHRAAFIGGSGLSIRIRRLLAPSG